MNLELTVHHGHIISALALIFMVISHIVMKLYLNIHMHTLKALSINVETNYHSPGLPGGTGDPGNLGRWQGRHFHGYIKVFGKHFFLKVDRCL